MSVLFATGRIADLVVLFTVVEWALLAMRYRRTGRGIPPADLAIALLPGVLLLLAVRCALVEAWWGWTAMCLAASLPAHLTDLHRRVRRASA